MSVGVLVSVGVWVSMLLVILFVLKFNQHLSVPKMGLFHFYFKHI